FGVFTSIFNTSAEELAQALGPKSRLLLSGLIHARGTVNRYPVVTEFWLHMLCESDGELIDSLVEPYQPRYSSGVPARLTDDDVALATNIIRNANEPGVNLLLYGARGLDKQKVL